MQKSPSSSGPARGGSCLRLSSSLPLSLRSHSEGCAPSPQAGRAYPMHHGNLRGTNDMNGKYSHARYKESTGPRKRLVPVIDRRRSSPARNSLRGYLDFYHRGWGRCRRGVSALGDGD
ncbi:hypothetical protein SKAU_G00058460 [Synaphobranchus kaupii]|uniref:Uncharacterized protein n=1 Tax=Synaphobranchus kaupii TaxID=118154 RepID=A0A9Q1G4W6_SYNKA|nr:hypothetical protein SKAU_G00058460 [Synaphobranchus kaupii]